MKSLKLTFISFLICCANVHSQIIAPAQVNVSFDSFSTTINDVNAGGLEFDVSPVAMKLDFLTLDGVDPDYPDDLVGFCVELSEGVSSTTYNFDWVELDTISSDNAGQSGTSSKNIPVGGIGALSAARVNYLFENFYKGNQLSDWTRTSSNPDTLAFQLALWEVTHDSDLSFLVSGSNPDSFFINSGTSQGTRATNAISQAETMLAQLSSAGVTAGYTSASWIIHGISANGVQDLVTAVAVPEPSEIALAATVLMPVFLVIRKRIRKAKS